MKFDMRYWTERRIALVNFWQSIWGLGITTVLTVVFGVLTFNLSSENNRINNKIEKISREAQDLNIKIFCINTVMPKLEKLTTQLEDLPVLVSGCAKRPKEYCTNARSAVLRTKDSLLHLIHSTENNGEQFKITLDMVYQLEKIIFDRVKDHQDELINIAGQLNSQRRSLNFIDPLKLKCK